MGLNPMISEHVSREERSERTCEHGYLTHDLLVPLLADHSMAGRVRRPFRL